MTAAMRLPPRGRVRPARAPVVILNDASVARGGATGLALLAARSLRARGHAVTYVCGDAGDGGALEAEGIRTIALGGAALLGKPRLRAARDGLYDPAMRDGVARVIAEIDTPDTVYHLHGWAQILTPAVLDALAPVARRCFLHAHDYFLACPNGSFFDFGAAATCARTPLSVSCAAAGCDRRSRAHKVWRLARQAVLRRAFAGPAWAGVLQLHPGMAEGLARGGVPRALLTTVRNPVEPWAPDRIEAERNHGLAYVGRTASGKGVGLLCEAARRAGLPLRVLGSVEDRPDLVRAYPEVTFAGWTPRDRIAASLGSARVLVMPSRFAEPFGLVAPEAIRSGMPVAISDRALLARDVMASAVGLAVDVSGPDALAAGLRALHDRPDTEIAAMSRRGFAAEDAVAQTPETWTDQLVALYDRARTEAA